MVRCCCDGNPMALHPTRFRRNLLRWYDRHKRQLPWRGETDPYCILVSEIMLQQTRVAVVEDRYRTFLRQFPTVQKLARARQESVLAAWSGLGYYRRARNLHAAAQQVAQLGQFPRSAEELMRLPGLGRYTASAVASIAFGEPVPVVDGNVKRVLQRLTGRELTDREYWTVAAKLLEPGRPGDFNQALMELGAMVCVPGQPNCASCPVTALCSSRGKQAAKKRKPRKKATLMYALAERAGRIFLTQRASSLSLMPDMWELPALRRVPRRFDNAILQLRHSITTTDYQVLVFRARATALAQGRWVSPRELHRLPLTGLTRKILKRMNLLGATAPPIHSPSLA